MNIKTHWLWVGLVVGMLGALVTGTVLPDMLWVAALFLGLGVGAIVMLARQNWSMLVSRAGVMGMMSSASFLVALGFLILINLVAVWFPKRIDLTKDKVHSLSDQTIRMTSGLKSPVKAVLFSKPGAREKFRGLLENYAVHSSQFKIEYIDPDKEPTRVKQAGVKKYDSLVLEMNGRSAKIEDVTEEKITNEMIKLSRETRPQLCVLSGHGERDFESKEADGYFLVKEGLQDQAYEIKNVSLLQDAAIPPSCQAVMLPGVSKGMFEKEIQILANYLDQGGHVWIAVDTEIKSPTYPKELWALLEKWRVKVSNGMVVDPLSKLLGADASTAVVSDFNREHAIVKDFKGQTLFPFSRPLEVVNVEKSSLQAKWVARTTPTAWGEMEIAKIGKSAVGFEAGKDLKGPIVTVVAVDGKRVESASKASRVVVFGSSLVGTNAMARYAGNLDLVLNSISWVMEDDSMISIRAKEEGGSKVELTQATGLIIFWVSVVIVPVLMAILGIVIWVRRRKL